MDRAHAETVRDANNMSQAKQLEKSLKEAQLNKSAGDKQTKSKEWMRNLAKTHSKENTLRRSARRNKILGDNSQVVSNIEFGNIYLFSYDALHKKTLKYWDYHPIIIPFDVTKTGHILGLNFHYLPPMLRAKLLDAIMDIPTYKTDKQRTKISYDIISAFASTDLAKPCIHQYIPSHIEGNVIKISRDEWNYVVMLPLADFRSLTGSTSISRIYKDSKSKM